MQNYDALWIVVSVAVLHNYMQTELHNVETYAKIDQCTVTVLIYMV